ncbi:MAG: hypothetical protein WCT05_03795 [Lentisphaeria bacterium]
MARKNHILADDGEDAVIDKKAKRRLAKSKEQQQRSQSQVESIPQDDTMSKVALFCQEQRWREALLLCLQAVAKAHEEGREEAAVGLTMASQKIECSLRRQMAAAFIVKVQEMLKKEYLLDVC